MQRIIHLLHIRIVRDILECMEQSISALIEESPLSMRAIAKRAGVSASTVSRIAKDELDPTLKVANSILIALGFQMPRTFPRLCDTDATLAARHIIRGDDVGGPWVERLERWATNYDELILEAGRAAPLALREDLVSIRTSWPALRLYGAIAATGQKWAVSGMPAAVAMGAPEPNELNESLVYVEDGATALGLSVPHDPYGSHTLHILPFDGVSELDVWTRHGVVWADPIQVCIDLCTEQNTESAGLELLERVLNENE